MNNYDTSDFNRGQWQAQQQKLHATPARSPRLPRPKKSPYATPINRKPQQRYEPAPHWFKVLSTSCLFFAGVFVLMFVLVVILHMQLFAR